MNPAAINKIIPFFISRPSLADIQEPFPNVQRSWNGSSLLAHIFQHPKKSQRTQPLVSVAQRKRGGHIQGSRLIARLSKDLGII
jgi:hypothetical protein